MTDEAYKNYEDTAGIRAGDKVVLERLFKTYYSSLRNYAKIIIKNGVIADDLVQEVFLKLLESNSIIIIDHTAKTYLFRAVHNQCINYLKSLKTTTSLGATTSEEILNHSSLITRDFEDNILVRLTSAEMLTYINKEIELLPPQCREIFLLNRQSDMTYNQISEKLGISYNTVKTQVMRALDRLREALKNF